MAMLRIFGLVFGALWGILEAIGGILYWAELFGWQPNPISRRRLKRLSREQLKCGFDESYQIATRQRAGDRTLSSFEGDTAIEKCVQYVDRLSEMDGGPHGNRFRDAYRDELRKEIERAAKENK